nr:acetate/propionate family kinase [Nitrospiraceae bacterium]
MVLERKRRKTREVKPVLSFNLGSSSLKFSLFLMGGKEALLARGEVERIGLESGRFWIRDAENRLLEDAGGDFSEHGTAVRAVFSALERLNLPKPAAVGHRVVHGGPAHASPAMIDRRLINELKRLIRFAPLHLPYEIRCMETVARHFPEIAQAACFDTAFHRRMPEAAQRFPLPGALWDKGLRRYGFHGLSYEYAMSALGKRARGRVVIAHLGNGASMAAVKNGRPMDTTMGFTPTGGFMMGTRSGDLDPGLLIYLMTEKGYDAGMIDRLVN